MPLYAINQIVKDQRQTLPANDTIRGRQVRLLHGGQGLLRPGKSTPVSPRPSTTMIPQLASSPKMSFPPCGRPQAAGKEPNIAVPVISVKAPVAKFFRRRSWSSPRSPFPEPPVSYRAATARESGRRWVSPKGRGTIKRPQMGPSADATASRHSWEILPNDLANSPTPSREPD